MQGNEHSHSKGGYTAKNTPSYGRRVVGSATIVRRRICSLHRRITRSGADDANLIRIASGVVLNRLSRRNRMYKGDEQVLGLLRRSGWISTQLPHDDCEIACGVISYTGRVDDLFAEGNSAWCRGSDSKDATVNT